MNARKAEEYQMLIHTKRAAGSQLSRLEQRRASQLGSNYTSFPAPEPEVVPHSFDVGAAEGFEARAREARVHHRRMLQTRDVMRTPGIEPRGKDVIVPKISPLLQDRRVPGQRGWKMKGGMMLRNNYAHGPGQVTYPTARGFLRSTTIA